MPPSPLTPPSCSARSDPSVAPSDWDYDPAAYGDGCAEFYDQIYPRLPTSALATLVRLGADRPLLDLGVGTGRAAIPLARRGCDIWGIDASQSMLRKLREKAGELPIPVVRSDVTRFALRLRFGLVFSLVSSLSLLPVRKQQACLRCAAAHLRDDGVLLIETAGVSAQPALIRIPIHTAVGPREYRARTYGSSPERLDRMAARAGLMLRHRWQDWLGTPWHASALHCISVYERR